MHNTDHSGWMGAQHLRSPTSLLQALATSRVVPVRGVTMSSTSKNSRLALKAVNVVAPGSRNRCWCSGEPMFIDAAHEYEAVRDDFQAWSPYVVPGGWVSFHDAVPRARHR